MRRKQFVTLALSAALCGSLAFGSVVAAAPQDPTPPGLPPLPSLTTPPPAAPEPSPSATTPTPWFTLPTWSWPPAPNASASPTPSPTGPEFDPAYDDKYKRKQLATTWKGIGKFGNGAGDTADFAGTVLSGEKDKKVLDALEVKANLSLDNLLGGFAGGPPSSQRAAAYRVLADTIQNLKKENAAMKDAGIRGDLAGLMVHAGFSMMHMSFLAADVFINIAFGIVQQVLPFPVPQFPGLTPQPTKTPQPAQTPQAQ